MTERSLGSNFKWFVAKVVNRGDGNEGKKDNTESGRVQIRIYGKHDDTTNIPDDKLPWAVPMLPLGSGASLNGQGSTPAGLKKNTTVIGFYADKDETMPILMGILVKAGKDPGNDGETVLPEESSTPKGARSKDTKGEDKNDVLEQRMTEDVAKKGQFHLDKKTIGNIPFDGGGVIDAIKSADPSNLAGSIPGALNGMKSVTSTLAVAGSLLANFKALTSGKLSITGLLAATTNLSGAVGQIAGQISGVGGQVGQIAGAVSGISGAVNQAAATTLVQNFGGVSVNMVMNGALGSTARFGNIVVNLRNTTDARGNILSTSGSIMNNGVVLGTGNMTQIAVLAGGISPQVSKILGGIQAASIASNLAANAFNGGNPLQSIIGGLGGLTGLLSLAAKAEGLLGPLTANFGAATAIANTLRSSSQAMFAGAMPAPFKTALPPSIAGIAGNIGNIAGITGALGAGIPGISGALGGFGGGINAALGAVGNISSLVNSAIAIPAITLNALNQISRINPGIGINVDPNIARNLNTIATVASIISSPSRGAFSAFIVPNYNYNSATYNINSLQNSSITLALPPVLANRSIQSTIGRNRGINIGVSGKILTVLGR
jgi:hypothetical protein